MAIQILAKIRYYHALYDLIYVTVYYDSYGMAKYCHHTRPHDIIDLL